MKVTVLVFPCDDGLTATLPTYPGMVTQARSMEELRPMLDDLSTLAGIEDPEYEIISA
jgi:predicted RNase H-like HicB family nuclease